MAAPQAYTLHRVTAPAGARGTHHIKDMVDLHPGFEIGGKTYYVCLTIAAAMNKFVDVCSSSSDFIVRVGKCLHRIFSTWLERPV
jgi:hypothetical protein